MSGTLRGITASLTSDSLSAPAPESGPVPAPTSDSAPNPLHNPLPNPPSFVSLSLGERLRDVFPPGLEASSTSLRGLPYTFTPQHLLDVFLGHSGSRHASDTVVTSAWYGKQTKSARHEYIVAVIEDLQIPGLKNFMSIDRNQGDPASPGGFPTITAISSSTTACDMLRVAYDGDLDRFLSQSRLTPHQILEHLYFEKPLSLHTLVTLVHHISEQHGKYNPMDTNCYWFTGLIWGCMHKLSPGAKYEPHLPEKKGRIAFVRNVTNPVQIRSVVRDIQVKLELLDSDIPIPNDLTGEAEDDLNMTEISAVEVGAVETIGGDLNDGLTLSAHEESH